MYTGGGQEGKDKGVVNLWKCLSELQRIRERGHAGQKGVMPPGGVV